MKATLDFRVCLWVAPTLQAQSSGDAACARRIDSVDGSSSKSVSSLSRSKSTSMNHLLQQPQVASNCIGSARSGW